jgi:hypothetical protein
MNRAADERGAAKVERNFVAACEEGHIHVHV